AVGDDDRLVMERVEEFLNALIRAAGRRVDLGRTLHVESFVRSFVVKLLEEGIELGLLLKQVGAGWASGFFFERQVHALMPAVLLRMTRPDAFDADAQAKPPHREAREIEQPVGRSEGNAIVGADGLRQTTLFEQALKGSKSGILGIRFHSFAQQQITRSMIGNRQRITVALVAEPELAFIVSASQRVGAGAV